MTTTPTRRAARTDADAPRRSTATSTTTGPGAPHLHDRFDDVPEGTGRVGAHRGRRPFGRGLIVLAWAALAVGIIVGGGVLALAPLFPKSQAVPAASGGPRAEKTAAPVTDPSKVDPSLSLQITVLNASPDDNADKTVGDLLKAKGWPVNGTADASVRNVKTTVVYYSSRALEGVARGLVQQLGVGQVQLSDAFPGAPVTIVVGSDYKS